MALLKAKIGSSSSNKKDGILVKSVSKPTQRKDFFRLISVSEGKISPELLPWLLLLNPADIYRLINLSGFDAGAQGLGVMSLAGDLPVGQTVLWLCLLAWVVVILAWAHRAFAKRTG